MTPVLEWALDVSIAIHLLLGIACLWRIWFARTAVDRLIAVDVVSTLVLALLVLLAIHEGLPMLLDVAIGLAAVGFTGSILLAQLIADDPDASTAEDVS